MIDTMLAYTRWANALVLDCLAEAPPALLEAPQAVVFGSILRTAHHGLLIGEVWRAHLLGTAHGHTSRNPADCPPLAEIATRQRTLDRWYCDYAATLEEAALLDVVRFPFLDGGEGAMSRAAILLHIANHATYHRGHIGAMLNAGGVRLPASDLPVYLAQL